MTSSSNFAPFSQYVDWALYTVNMPMILEYEKRKDFVTVKIPADFITSDVCDVCDEVGPHFKPDHIFRIILTSAEGETTEMTLFNDRLNVCAIPPTINGYELLKAHVTERGNECYFYGKTDEDDRSLLYINVKKLPAQDSFTE